MVNKVGTQLRKTGTSEVLSFSPEFWRTGKGKVERICSRADQKSYFRLVSPRWFAICITLVHLITSHCFDWNLVKINQNIR